MGGWVGDATNVIDYITIGSTGNATDFGDLTTGKGTYLGATGSSTRGLSMGGMRSSTYSYDKVDVIDYVTIASTGNASDFGDLSSARHYNSATSNNTRGLSVGGSDSSNVDIVEYVTIASTGNATDFGNLSAARNGLAAVSASHGGL